MKEVIIDVILVTYKIFKKGEGKNGF